MTTKLSQDASLSVGYLVHDVDDAAVKRRITMLKRANCNVSLYGFKRENLASAPGQDALILGSTRDAALLQRALAVLKNLVFRSALKASLADSDVLIARNLEMLVLAHSLKNGRPVIYECLDIHRTLLGSSFASRLIQKIEDRLVRQSSTIITSSPGFIRNYFDKKPNLAVEIALFENKVLSFDAKSERPVLVKPSPPWTIGWFGMLRCKRTFDTLAQLSTKMPGSIRILIAGKPSLSELPNFHEDLEKHQHMTYVGPYKPENLPDLYAQCHFAWCIDWFEEGLNSAWLLPNRIYEASAQTVVPIAIADVETGVWLKQRNCGLILENNAANLAVSLLNMTQETYRALQIGMHKVPESDIFATDDECFRLSALLESSK
jgi:succinoglycan biosynthesis protein ExoL